MHFDPSSPLRTNTYRQQRKQSERAHADGAGFIFLLPPVIVTLTKRRVYVSLFFARPLGVFFFSWGSTFGVAERTLPARAREPCTLPIFAEPRQSYVTRGCVELADGLRWWTCDAKALRDGRCRLDGAGSSSTRHITLAVLSPLCKHVRTPRTYVPYGALSGQTPRP